jgi:hypothetical protein
VIRRVPRVGERIELGGGAALRFVAVNGNDVLARAAANGRFRSGVSPNENDYSIAFVLRMGDFELFSGGDLSGEDTHPRRGRREVYDDVESAIGRSVGNIEVLRVNHHGSGHSTNEAFVAALRPEVSLISCGDRNSFGHPAAEVVRRLAPLGPVAVTSGLAREWRFRPDPPAVAGDVKIRVLDDGARYTVAGTRGFAHAGESYSDWEEVLGLDHFSVEQMFP